MRLPGAETSVLSRRAMVSAARWANIFVDPLPCSAEVWEDGRGGGCGFCSDGDSTPEEENVIVPGGGHRRAQITIRHQACDVLDISTRTDDVNTACCDETNDHCAAGVPTTCDARCAMTFLP